MIYLDYSANAPVSPRVGIAAAMEANAVVAWLLGLDTP